MRRIRFGLLVVGCTVVLGIGGLGHAEQVGFEVFDNPSDVDTASLDFNMDVRESDESLLMMFRNDATTPSSLTDLYFEVGYLQSEMFRLESNAFQMFNNRFVSFEPGADPIFPPGQDEIDWEGNAFSFGAEEGFDRSENGVNQDEIFALVVDKASPEVGVDDLIDLLGEQGTRIVGLVREVGGVVGADVSIVADPEGIVGPFDPQPGGNGDNFDDVGPISAPLPSAVGAGFVLFGGLVLRRPRR